MGDVASMPQASVVEELGGREPAVKNWAEQARVRERIEREIAPFVQWLRDRKAGLNEHWRQLRRIWTLEHDEQSYVGRSNLFLPAAKKAIETRVSQLVSATFPSGDTFDVMARREELVEAANSAKAVLQLRIDQAKVRVSAEAFYRQLEITGNSVAKVRHHRHAVRNRVRKWKRSDDLFGVPQDEETVLFDGPTFEVLDVANFYAWPDDVASLNDCELVAEDLTVSASHLRRMAAKGIYVRDAVEGAIRDNRGDNHDLERTDRLASARLESTHDAGAPAFDLVDITEVWCEFDPAADSQDEERDPVPFLIVLSASGKCIRAIENPFWHKRPPYLLGRMQITNGRLWGTGTAETIRALQLLLNDQVNQGMDCATYALNPIVLANPDLLPAALSPLEPGVQWLVRDVNGAVKFDRPPQELVQTASVLASQSMSWMNDFGGAPPVLQGGSAPGRAFRTATGIGAAQRNAVLPLQEVVRLQEAEVWERMLYLFWAIDQQYAEDDFVIAATGKPPQRVPVQALAGDWMFKWLASTQADNAQVKGSQILQMLQVVANPGMVQLLAQNGVKLDPSPLIRKLYTEVYGFRDADRVLLQAGPPQAVPSGPGAPGAAQPPEGLPQQAPEENAELAAVREQSEELSGDVFGPMGAAGPMGGELS